MRELHPIVIWDNMDRTTRSATFGRRYKVNRFKVGFKVVATLLLLALALIVGIDSPEREQSVYCTNVANGIHPDYEGAYRESCGGKEPPQFHQDLAK